MLSIATADGTALAQTGLSHLEKGAPDINNRKARCRNAPGRDQRRDRTMP
jgi:hypothetical protein